MWYADGHGGRDGKTGFAGASAPKGRGTSPRVGLVATNVVRFCVEFEWDQEKAEANLRKHGVAFEDAARVFLDPNRIETFDGREDYGEDRWRTVGLVDPALLAVV